ncbi:hypothetical protein HWQ46_21680 [Shewanella sp. D64]|uniref:hypothetical protein n=1 Tax=unclassified Shewanella TaxID=196818 RepID=UPI0022BA5FCB|nr:MULTISPECIES: hypothetical protein [unclassified Shewanella]MEC4728151.1 hypothetical protein [Shewanella sp. D64]MEC4740271.1 hypothetical protein [Shewanella sp. E94]WBJ94412.1 hypothetical protein HWQ47_21470 [Shewanella sp. MTB7]
MINHALAVPHHFDLSNPQHLAMRRLMADVYQRHNRSLNRDLPDDAIRYAGMAECLERVSSQVLKDSALKRLCFELSQALEMQSIVHERGLSS